MELTRFARACGRPVINASGLTIGFAAPYAGERSAARYEERIAHSGAIEHRDASWHDLFNALVWITFPRAKAALNRRHVAELASETHNRRSAVRDALTQFDEDGIVVVSEQADLLEALQGFRWQELFWQRRSEVLRSMRWFVFGHAQYEKALQPFIGLTAKALMVTVDLGFCAMPYPAQLEHVDRSAAELIGDPGCLVSPCVLAPVPVLGIPGWCAENQHASFYEDTQYFRSGRRCKTG